MNNFNIHTYIYEYYKSFFLFYRKVLCAMTTFPAGLYHFFECYNCEFIISVDQGEYFYSKIFLNCIKIEIYYQMLNHKNLKNLYFSRHLQQ